MKGKGFAFLVLFFPAVAFAAPSISSSIGSLTHGTTITVSGSFSAVATTDTCFDDFELGTFAPCWLQTNDLSIVNLVESTNPYSAKSAYLNFRDGFDDGQLQGGARHRDTYESYRVKISTDWDWGTTGFDGNNKFLSNIKPCRNGNASNTLNDNFIQLQLGGDVGAYWSVEGVPAWPDNVYGGLTKHSFSSSAWHRLDCENHDSASDGTTPDGSFRAWFDGQLVFSTVGVITQDGGVDNPKLAYDVGFPNAWSYSEDGGGGMDPSDDAPNELWLDDALVQGTLARIELSTCSASYTACSVRVPQRVTTMTSSAASFIANLNGLRAGVPVYAWPTDAAGVQGAPYQLNTTAISVSGNVRISGNVRFGQ